MIYYMCFIYCDEQLRVLWKCNFSENAHTIQGPEAKSWSLQSENLLVTPIRVMKQFLNTWIYLEASNSKRNSSNNSHFWFYNGHHLYKTTLMGEKKKTIKSAPTIIFWSYILAERWALDILTFAILFKFNGSCNKHGVFGRTLRNKSSTFWIIHLKVFLASCMNSSHTFSAFPFPHLFNENNTCSISDYVYCD